MLYYMSSLHEKSQVTDLQQQTTKNAVCFFLCLMMILTCSSVAITAAGAAAAAVAIIDIVLLIGCYILLYIYLLGDRFFTDGLQSLPTYSAVSVLPQQCIIAKRSINRSRYRTNSYSQCSYYVEPVLNKYPG